MLDLRGVNASYGTIQALKNISIKVGIGDIVTIIGANGAGKTSLLKTISGVMELKLPVPRCAGRLPAPWCRESSRQRKSFSCCSSLANPRGKLREMRSPSLFKSGAIWYQGINLLQCAPVKIVAMGISQVPEGRQLFSRLTVLDNLYLGAYLYDNRKFKTEIKEQLDWIYSLFPVLKKQAKQLAGTIHAGEQQMLAIGRALMARPKVLLLDEPSRGLALPIVDEIFKVILRINDHGISILLAEQNARAALKIARYGYVLETGSVVQEGPAQDLLADKKILEAYRGK